MQPINNFQHRTNTAPLTRRPLPSPKGEGLGVRSLSLSRGFTVLFIPIIHSFMLYGNDQTHQSGIVTFLTFIAEWPGAQLFMLLMGIYFSLSKNTTLKKVMLRSIVLLIFAYLLNYIKFVLPKQAGILPQAFLNDITPTNYPLILIGDILHFAAISLPILYLIKKLTVHPLIPFIIAICICFISPLVIPNVVTYLTPDSRLLTHHSLSLISGQPPNTYFPLLPWLAYPLTGLTIGHYIKEAGSKTFAVLLPAGLGLMAIGFYFGSKEAYTSFYRTGPWHTIQHIGFVCTWLTAWHIVSRICIKNLVFTFILFLSRNITLIYLIQWPLIIWLLPVIGYHQSTLTESIIISLEITLITLGSTYLLSGMFNKKHSAPT